MTISAILNVSLVIMRITFLLLARCAHMTVISAITIVTVCPAMKPQTSENYSTVLIAVFLCTVISII